ncbi:MAG TPA: DedA family protein [Candidatus Saccharimonadales bacterium]|jgi:membrane protein DedA with SNARE-associated domain|nr:DedA family protein [Candidatus Saccharimonadales bacterium]
MTHIASQLPAVITSIEPFVHKYGYLGIGSLLLFESMGIPIPGESTLIAAAVFAGLGQLNIFVVILIGLVACVIGDSFGFLIGLVFGRRLIEKYGKYILLDQKKYLKVEKFFNKRGPIIVIFARFFEVLRQLNGFIAGTSGMRWRLFFLFNIIGSLLWVSVWSVIGYFGGSNIGLVLKYELYLSIGLGIFIVLWLYRYLLIRRKKQNAR